MMNFIPLKRWPGALAPVNLPFASIAPIGFLPLALSELLLSAHYYPLGLDLTEAEPVVGAIVQPEHLARPMVNAKGVWSGAYMPISLRCFPFRLKKEPLSGNALEDLEVALIRPPAEHRQVIRIKDEAGEPSKELQAIHEGLSSVRTGQLQVRSAIDSLMISQVLIPIEPAKAYHTVDRSKVSQMSNVGLEAMTRSHFHAIDLMTAIAFSQAHLPAALRPVPAPPTTGAKPAGESLFDAGIDTITPWLDTSELFPQAWLAKLADMGPPAAT